MTIALGGIFIVLIGIIGYQAWKSSRVKPEERERRRRAWLAAAGKMGDATLVEVQGDLLFYSYSVRGVEYTASQDAALLKQYVPRDLSEIGPVSVRYDARNPANSIVVSEQWSGLRANKV